jgi:hypothetical protein
MVSFGIGILSPGSDVERQLKSADDDSRHEQAELIPARNAIAEPQIPVIGDDGDSESRDRRDATQ